jgi:hypothetical protein
MYTQTYTDVYLNKCPKLEVWYDGLKGGLALEAVQY